jgi:hypothetical protein
LLLVCQFVRMRFHRPQLDRDGKNQFACMDTL